MTSDDAPYAMTAEVAARPCSCSRHAIHIVMPSRPVSVPGPFPVGA